MSKEYLVIFHEDERGIARSWDIVGEIVRCKDCKYYAIWELKSDYTSDKRFRPSVCIIGQYAVHRNADYYCADGERKDNDSMH